MSRSTLTLDVDEPQVCVHYPDSDFSLHHRVLMVAGIEGKWVIPTPDHELESVTLTDITAVPLAR